MNGFRNSLQYASVAARIHTRKKSRLLYDHAKSTHSIGHREIKAFRNELHKVVDTIATHPGVAEIPDMKNWIHKILNHNLTGGKVARGLTTIMAYETLENPDNITEESMSLARILGWCVEMAYLVIMDDMIDSSTTRRGQPCWYLMPGVGIASAMNDSILVHNGMFYLLKMNFGDRPNYVDMMNAINETMLCTAFGQFLDIKTSQITDKNYKSTFTPERHLAIIKYKTAYYTYNLPINLGLLLTGNKLEGKMKKQVQDLNLDLGTLFQIQDDYIDCYSDEILTGKAGSDIQEGKCSWLAVNALQRCTDAQTVVFNACYGSKEPAHIERIKVLYDQLKLPELYQHVEGKYYDGILEKIMELPTEEWRRLFHNILGITYQRKK